MNKEPFKSRMTAEAFYNELWQVDAELRECILKKEVLENRKLALLKINRFDLK